MAKHDFKEPLSLVIDVDKDVFLLIDFDRDGQLVMRKMIKRLAPVATFEQLPRCAVKMEPCLSAHFVSRTLPGLGLERRSTPAIYVEPLNTEPKNA